MINFREKIKQVLIWSEKYTQTDMIYLAKGGFWLTLGQIISIAASFLLVVAFANLLPIEIYGQYQYILSIVAVLTIFTLPGMNLAITQASARGYEGCFIPGLKMRIRWGILGGLISLSVAGYYFFNHNLTLAISFLIITLFLPLMDPPSIFYAYLSGKKLFKLFTKYTLIIQIISAGCLIIVLFLTNELFLILLVYFISYTILHFIFLNIVLKKNPPNKEKDLRTLSYGKHLSLMEVVSFIAVRMDYILLWHFLGAGALAVYSFALIVPQKITSLFSGIIRPLIFPKLSEKNSKNLKVTLPQKAFKLFLILIPITVIYIILAPFLYRIFFPKYLESVFYSQIFAISILLLPEVLFSTSLLSQMEKVKLYIYKFTAPLIRITLLLILTPIYGIMGAILAIVIAQLSAFGIAIFLFKRM